MKNHDQSVTTILSNLLKKMSKDLIEKEAPFLVNAFHYVVDTNPWRAVEFLTHNITIPEGWCLVFYLDLIKNNINHTTSHACTIRLHEALFDLKGNQSRDDVDRLLSNYIEMKCPQPAQLVKQQTLSKMNNNAL